jgi:hypothetical protein
MRIIILASLLFLANISLAQTTPPELEIDQSAFTMIPDTNIQKRLIKSVSGFLNEKNNGSLNNKHIDPEYLKKNSEPFQHIQDIEMNGGKPFFYPTLLRAIPLEDHSIMLKIAYLGVGKESLIPYLRIIATLIAKKNVKGDYYFYNAIDHYTRNWERKQIGTINYVYSGKFDIKNAVIMNKFNSNFAHKLNTKVLKVTYYKFEDPEQMFKTMGYDFLENMYFSRVGGLAQSSNNTVFAGNNSERYEHEVVHFYTYNIFPNGTKNVHEGYATYIGGSGGLPLKNLVPIAKKYIDSHPNEDLVMIATDFYPRTPEVQLTYVLSAIVCQDIDERFGMTGIKKLFNPTEGDDYFANLKKITGVDKQDFPKYILKLLNK